MGQRRVDGTGPQGTHGDVHDARLGTAERTYLWWFGRPRLVLVRLDSGASGVGPPVENRLRPRQGAAASWKKLASVMGSRSATGFLLTSSIVIDPELGENLARMWIDGGLEPKIEKTGYGARRQSLIVTRSIDIPWAWTTNGILRSRRISNAVGNNVPRAGSLELRTRVPRRHRSSCGTTSRKNVRIRPPSERSTRKSSDFVNYWRLYAPVVDVIPFWAVRPEVTSWRPLHRQPAVLQQPAHNRPEVTTAQLNC